MYSRYIGLCPVEFQMPKERKSSSRKRSGRSTALSTRTKKQIDTLPKHAQHIFTKVHANAVEQYKNPAKRRGGKRQSAEEVAHKAAWAAVKNKYRKKGDKWVSKE
jgi:cation transport regulator